MVGLYVFADGLERSLVAMNWTRVDRDDVIAYTKLVSAVTEVLVFRKSKAWATLEVHGPLDNTNGITFDEFAVAYAAANGGGWPVMPM